MASREPALSSFRKLFRFYGTNIRHPWLDIHGDE
jgi:hypothetical protein